MEPQLDFRKVLRQASATGHCYLIQFSFISHAAFLISLLVICRDYENDCELGDPQMALQQQQQQQQQIQQPLEKMLCWSEVEPFQTHFRHELICSLVLLNPHSADAVVPKWQVLHAMMGDSLGSLGKGDRMVVALIQPLLPGLIHPPPLLPSPYPVSIVP